MKNAQRPLITGLLFLPVAFVWFRLLSNLWPEWSTNPQYGYGMVVPILCAGLALRRYQRLQSMPREEGQGITAGWGLVFGWVLLSLMYFPIRLVEEATPEWRPIQWAFAFQAVGLTLCAVYVARGKRWAWEFAFPVVFFLVAIPWPSLIEQPIIQGLTRFTSAVVVEIMGVLGVPAVQHGNVIEVGTGVVGVEEACSGIRSFQSSLMISLFIGEFFMFTRGRRWLFVPMGFALAIGLNVGRTAFLTYAAAKKGVGAVAEYHDQAGFTILLACTAAMWAVALLLKRRQAKASSVAAPAPVAADVRRLGEGSEPTGSASSPRLLQAGGGTASARRFALGLIVWILLTEAAVFFWYESREARIVPGPSWTIVFPTNNPTFKDIPIDDKTLFLLRYDEGSQAQWTEEDGTRWMGFFCRWLPGRVAGYLAKRHTPDICLPASGRELQGEPELTVLKIHGIELPVRSYVFSGPAGPLFVFHSRWEVGVNSETFTQQESARFNLVRGIWAGRGKHGQTVFEFIAQGYPDAEQAKAALVKQLERSVRVGSEEPVRR